MPERQSSDVKPTPTTPGGSLPPGLVIHKGTKECPMLEAHPEQMCGIVASRRRRSAEMAAEGNGGVTAG
jgi:hypothetical protein